MDLILWRHADAEDGTADSERRLTAKGLKQAQRMARWLRPRLPADAVVVASPAQRTLQTARALNMEVQVAAGVGTSASAESLLDAIGWPKFVHTVVLVGHQPTLGETAALLLSGTKQPWGLKKGALIWLAYRGRGGSSRMQLRAAMSPDLL